MWTLLHGCSVDYSIACSLFTDRLFSLESPSSTLLKIKNRGDLLTPQRKWVGVREEENFWRSPIVEKNEKKY